MARKTTTQRIVIALSSTLLLAGCTSAADVPDESPSTSASTSTEQTPAAGGASESGTEAAPRPVPSVTVTPAPVTEPVAATGVCEINYVDAADAGTLGDVDIEVVRDRGSREGASGTVTTASDGTPASYLVAAGDISERIADRFCVSADYLDALNSVRRDGVTIDSLYGGDTLNLSPYTVLSVGDQNGRVLDNPEPDPMPAQVG